MLTKEGTDVELMAAAQVLGIDIYVYHKWGKKYNWLKFPCINGATPETHKAVYVNICIGNVKSDYFDYILAT